MDSKETVKKTWMKIGFGILFVAACFIAMYILMEFHGDILMVGLAAVLLLIAAFLFLNAVFSDKAKKMALMEPEPEETEKVIPGGSNTGEFHLKVSKHMKEMESAQKELIEVLKNQNTLLQTQIENLEHEIYMLSEKQMNQAKSIIKFNKENARQLAISERETLEYVMTELKKAIEEKTYQAAPEAMAAATVSAASMLEEVSEAELFEVEDFAGDEEEVVIPDLPEPEPVIEDLILPEEPAAEEIEIPDLPEDIDLSELFDIPELFENPEETPGEALADALAEPAVEDIVIPEAVEEVTENVLEEAVSMVEETPEEAAPAPDPLAGLSGDPNAMMTPEDIAKLLASMGQ